MKQQKIAALILAGTFIFIIGYYLIYSQQFLPFNGQNAYQHVLVQTSFGPRTPGSEAHAKTIAYIRKELEQHGWEVQVIEQEINHLIAKNILATRPGETPAILLMAHYDSRFHADNDPNPENHLLPVLGANDGASGVAVLLELGRVIPQGSVPIGLLFIDLEDNGNMEGWDWILGSTAFVRDMNFEPEAVILLDMIGDADLNIYQESLSDDALTQSIWKKAAELGYENYFIPQEKYAMVDDHIPFIQRGIRAVDLIDFDYPYWHTTHDTPDKVSAESLQVVGHTLVEWLKSYRLGQFNSHP